MMFPTIVFLAAATAGTAQPLPRDTRLDVREPPFGEFDFAWMNGSNAQPASLLAMGPLTWSLYVDTYFAWQVRQPADHTIFPTTTGPRHNEISLNLAHIGVDVTGLDGPTGRLYLQYGSIVETIAGQDTTTTRGFYLTNRLLQYVQQAAAGWHFHALHGVNVELGIFPSYVGLESYLPEENWCYTHALLADATPYYFFGFRGQGVSVVAPKDRTVGGQWLANFRRMARGARWRLSLELAATRVAIARQFGIRGDGSAGRPRLAARIFRQQYSNSLLRAHGRSPAPVDVDLARRRRRLRAPRKCALRAHGRGHADATLGLDRALEERAAWGFFLRRDAGDFAAVPGGRALPLAGNESVPRGGVTATVDYWPSPWLVTRLEYAHRIANQPLFSGPGGITGPGGLLPASDQAAATFTPDLRRTDDRLLFNVTLRL